MNVKRAKRIRKNVYGKDGLKKEREDGRRYNKINHTTQMADGLRRKYRYLKRQWKLKNIGGKT